MALTPGSRIGPYEITAPLGAGGMGEVWKARDTTLGRDVAIKTLPEAFAADADRVARFEREAKLLAALNHANIATIHGLERADAAAGSGQAPTLALVMELVEGETLADRLARGALHPQEATRLALQIAEALEAAHEKGIVHRDLKPANVKVTPDGKVKVLDFGLAKAFEEDAARPELTNSPTLSLAATQQGVILGTAAYMSPEQASGMPTDRRADIWSFGVVFFEMLTGRQLFSGKTVSYILADVLRSEPDWKALPPNLHPRLRLMLERCLEKEPRDRQHDIGDVRVDLQRVLADPGGVVVAPAPAPVGSPATTRSAWPMAAAAALAAALVTGAAGWFFRPIEPPQVVRLHQELPGAASFWNLNYPTIVVSPDGRQVAYMTSDGAYLLSADALEPRLIPGTQPPANAVADLMFSPDGQWIAYANASTLQLQKQSVNGGAPVSLAAVATTYNGGTWTTDNDILFAQGQAVMRVSADGGTPEALFESATGVPLFPELLPGGRAVSFTVSAAQGFMTVVRTLDGEGTETSFPGARARYLPTGHVLYFLQSSLFAQPFDLDSRTPVGGPVPLVEDVLAAPVPQFSVSASGSLAYIPGGVASAAQRLVPALVDANGRREEIAGIPPAQYSSPRVSPDGTRVALQTTDEVPANAQASRLWVHDVSGDTAPRAFTQAGKNFHPIWTPDSQRLTFYSDRDGARGIYWQAADGTGVPERLTTAEEGTEHWPDAWSPDGRTLAYQIISPSTGQVDLWTLSLDAPDEPKPLFAQPERQHGAAFSPDGRWIAYGSTEGSPNAEQVYVEPFPPTGERHQLTRASGAFPVWAPDGSTLFYRRNAISTAGETATEFVQVDIVGGQTFRWRNERQVPVGAFQIFGAIRDYDVLPDGHFLMLFPEERQAAGEAQRPRVNLVLNWFEELQARVPIP